MAAIRSLLHRAALHDWLTLGYLSYCVVRAWGVPDGPQADNARWVTASLFGFALLWLLLTRTPWSRCNTLRITSYRLGLFAVFVASYFMMGVLLPALHPLPEDGVFWGDKLFWHLDRLLFGETPGISLAPHASPAWVAWSAFFYGSYFPLVTGTLLGGLLFSRGAYLRDLAFGALLIGAIGQSTYTLVPGRGPYAVIAFEQPLDGGLWWDLIEALVSHAGAQLDIFPSLHTALPCFLAIHLWRYRHLRPHLWWIKHLWWMVAVVASQIIVATFLLRWHWAIDVLAGLALACFAAFVGSALMRREHKARLRAGKPEAWESLPWA